MNPVSPTPDHIKPQKTSAPTEGAAETGMTTDLPSSPADWSNPASVLRPPQGPDEIGRIATFRVLKLLGAGGMGAVFAAKEAVLERAVALKVMRPDLITKPEAKERFLREAKTAAAVEHDHIIPVFQVGDDEGLLFIAMPLLKGETLEDRLHRDGHLSVADTLKVGRETAEGLAEAHAQDLVHRDIKPANLWLEKTGSSDFRRVKILDFGLARPVHEDAHLTSAGGILGTPSYMSPQQAAGDEVDHRSDLFSLGAVLYRCLTGTLPFPGASTIAVLSALASKNPPPIREKNPAVPPALADYVMKLLTKDPAGRPASASEVVAALSRIETSGVVDSHAETVAIPKARKPKRRLGWAVAAALFGFVVALAGVIVIKVRGPDGKETEVRVPEGSKVEVDEKGNVAVVLPGARQSGNPEVVGKELPVATPPARSDPPELEFRLKAEEVIVSGILPMADNRRIVSAEWNGWLRVWDLTTRQATISHNIGCTISAIAIHPDGKTVLAACTGGLLLTWDATTGKEIRRYPIALRSTEPIGNEIGYTKSGREAIIADNISRALISVDMSTATRRVLVHYPDKVTEAYAVVSPNGAEVAFFPTNAPWSIVDSDSGNLIWTSSQVTHACCPCFSPDGSLIAAQTRTFCCEVYDRNHLDRGPLVLSGPGQMFGAAFSPDGKRLAIGGLDVAESLRIIDYGHSRVPTRLWYGSPPDTILIPKYIPNGQRVVTRDNRGEIRVYNVSGIPMWKPPASIGAFWLARVRALPPAKQLKEVTTELHRRNPSFYSEVKTQTRHGTEDIVGLSTITHDLRDLAPLCGLPQLTSLSIAGRHYRGSIEDLSPIKPLNLIAADFNSNCIANIACLSGMPLVDLNIGGNIIDDLSPLRGKKLIHLAAHNNPIKDISALAGMPLDSISIQGTLVTDLLPLQSAPLRRLEVAPTVDLSPIANAPLQEIWFEPNGPFTPAQLNSTVSGVDASQSISG